MFDAAIVVLYLFVTLSIGILNSAKVSNNREYSTGGSQYSAAVIFCTLTASYTGGGFTIGLAEKTFIFGILYIIAMYGFSLKEILIAKYIAPRVGHFQNTCVTAGDIMKTAYGRVGKISTGFASIIVCGGVIGAQLAACGNIFESFLHIPSLYGTLITAGIIIIYVTLGGVKSVVKVNIFHFTMIVTTITLLSIFGLNKVGGIQGLKTLTPDHYFSAVGTTNYLTLFLLFLSFFLGETLVPPYMQRLLIGKNSRETTRGTFYSGIISIFIFTLVGIIGIIAYTINPTIQPQFAFSTAVSELLPVGLKGIGIAAMLAIIMSSADSFLHSTSLAVRLDILEPLGFKASGNTQIELRFLRSISFVVGVIATIFALTTDSVLDILLYSYQFWTPFILVPLVAAIYKVKTSSTVFILSSAAGIATVLLWNMMSTYVSPVKGSLEGVILGTTANLIAFTLLRLVPSLRLNGTKSDEVKPINY